MTVALVLLPLLGAVIGRLGARSDAAEPRKQGARRSVPDVLPRALAILVLLAELVLALSVARRGSLETATLLDLDLGLSSVSALFVAAATAAILVTALAISGGNTPRSPRVYPPWVFIGLSGSVLAIASANHLTSAAFALVLSATAVVISRRQDDGRRVLPWMILAGGALVFSDALNLTGPQSGLSGSLIGLSGVTTGLLVVGLGIGLGVLPFFPWFPRLAESAPGLAALLGASVGAGTAAIALARVGATPGLGDQSVGHPVIVLVGGTAAALSSFAALGAKRPARAVAFLASSSANLALVAVALSPTGESTGATLSLLVQVLAGPLALAALVGLGGSLSGALWRRPLLAVSLVAALFGLVGLPPSATFVGRSLVATSLGPDRAAFLVAVAISTAIGGVAATRTFAALLDLADAPAEPPRALDLAAFVLALAIIVGGVVPGPLLALLS